MTELYQPDQLKDLVRYYDNRVVLKGGQSIFAMRPIVPSKARIDDTSSVTVPQGYHLRRTRFGGFVMTKNPSKRT